MIMGRVPKKVNKKSYLKNYFFIDWIGKRDIMIE